MRRRAKIKSPLDSLKRKAWDTFSKFIRQRDGKCITCGGKPECAGHFWHGVLDFDEMNVNAQCKSCNIYRSGNLAPYSTYLINKYGAEEFKALEIRHYQAMKGEKRNELDYEKLVNRYTRKL